MDYLGGASIVRIDFSWLRQSHWYEYATRFVLGGLMTVVAGLIAKLYGPEVGGLFLAFPAIFPASVTLIERHERERKESGSARITPRQGGSCSGSDGSRYGDLWTCFIWRCDLADGRHSPLASFDICGGRVVCCFDSIMVDVAV
jgi:Protein of unknown function (DUF3147)